MRLIPSYIPENHKSLQARREGHENRWQNEAHKPNEDYRELSKHDGGRESVDTSRDVSLKIRG